MMMIVINLCFQFFPNVTIFDYLVFVKIFFLNSAKNFNSLTSVLSSSFALEIILNRSFVFLDDDDDHLSKDDDIIIMRLVFGTFLLEHFVIKVLGSIVSLFSRIALCLSSTPVTIFRFCLGI